MANRMGVKKKKDMGSYGKISYRELAMIPKEVSKGTRLDALNWMFKKKQDKKK